MGITQEPQVFLRYDSEHALKAFEAAFGRDLLIKAFKTDQAAVEALEQGQTPPHALFVLADQPSIQTTFPLLTHARNFYPGLLKILLSDAVPLDVLASLLEQRLIDRCFEQPVDPDLVRSHVLSSALTGISRDSEMQGAVAISDAEMPAVLIVDDESTATKYLARQLERLQDNFRVLCADSAEQAFERIRTANGAVGVVMTDQRMPGMQGKELLDELKQSHPEIVRILTSAYGEVNVALDAVNEGGIFRYQKKPWRATELLPLFQEAIARHLALTSARDGALHQREIRFAELRQQRRARLFERLSEPVNVAASGAVMTDFLQALDSIQPMAANTSHLRASQETSLENDLVEQFEEQVRQQLARLNAESTRPMLDQALTTLLTASGLSWSDLNVRQGAGNTQVLTSQAPLRLYAHLLAPLTTLSRPLLEQQVALLLLFVTTHRLGGRVHIDGASQSYELTLTLPMPKTPEA